MLARKSRSLVNFSEAAQPVELNTADITVFFDGMIPDLSS